MMWRAVCVGGDFDGFADDIFPSKAGPPAFLFAFRCMPACDGHLFPILAVAERSSHTGTADTYELAEVDQDQRVATYEQVDTTGNVDEFIEDVLGVPV